MQTRKAQKKETKISNSKDATIVITTHNCFENNMMKALDKINRLNFIRKKTVSLHKKCNEA